MDRDEVRQAYTMTEVAAMYGIHPDRKGFCHCPFHKGDRTASLKLYERDFHCFGCGANGDIFTFVQMMDHVDFKTAYTLLGGTYPDDKKGRYASHMKAYRAKKRRDTQLHMAQRRRAYIKALSVDIEYYRTCLRVIVPLSDIWCEIYNKMQYALYIYDALRQEGK